QFCDLTTRQGQWPSRGGDACRRCGDISLTVFVLAIDGGGVETVIQQSIDRRVCQTVKVDPYLFTRRAGNTQHGAVGVFESNAVGLKFTTGRVINDDVIKKVRTIVADNIEGLFGVFLTEPDEDI